MKESRTDKIMVRLTKEEKEILDGEAKKRGISVAALVRQALYTFLPALRGEKEKILLFKEAVCEACNGQGYLSILKTPENPRGECNICGGTGKMLKKVET